MRVLSRLALLACRHFPVDHGKWRLDPLIVKPEGAGPVRYTGHYGIKYDLDLSHTVMWRIYSRGIYEGNTIRHLAKMLRRGAFGKTPVFLDIGANIGVYSLLVAKLSPESQVHSFEPNPAALEILRSNIALNEVDNIHVHAVGLSDKEETCRLYNESMAQASLHKTGQHGDYIDIQVRPLDAVLDDIGVSRVDLIKIDVEGHEPAVLDGAERMFAHNKRMAVIMEIDKNAALTGTRDQLFRRMVDMGFSAYIPKGYPRAMKEVKTVPERYEDNVIFLRGFAT
jgi:FkbM family methyltransferase